MSERENGTQWRIKRLEDDVQLLREWKHRRADPLLFVVENIKPLIAAAVIEAFEEHEETLRARLREHRAGLSLRAQFVSVAIGFAGVGAAIAQALMR